MCKRCVVVAILLSTAGGTLVRGDAKQPSLRVASLSFVPVKWDKAANAATIEKMVREAAAQRAELIVTPEGALEGYVVNEVIREKDVEKKAELTRRFRAIAEPIDGAYVKRFRKLADELHVSIILGLLEAAGETLYNSAVLIGPDGAIVGKYHKSHFHQGYQVNPPGYTAGKRYPVFDVGPAKLGMMICFDRQLPEPARALALAGADLIVCPAYGGWGDWNTRLMQVRAYENQVYVVFTNPHHNLIIDPDGNLLGEAGQDSILIRDLDLSRPLRRRQSIIHRRPDTYDRLADPTAPSPE